MVTGQVVTFSKWLCDLSTQENEATHFKKPVFSYQGAGSGFQLVNTG